MDRPRRNAHERHLRGFALLEVMNFLALAGTLSAIGMYGMARYVRHAKTVEAVGSLTALGKESAALYEESDSTQPVGTTPDAAHAMRHFPPSSQASVPPSADDVKGKRYQSAPADWAPSPWHELHFSIPTPQYYQYSYVSAGSGGSAKATATAKGDLDGDGDGATYTIVVAPDAQYHAVVGEVSREDPDE